MKHMKGWLKGCIALGLFAFLFGCAMDRLVPANTEDVRTLDTNFRSLEREVNNVQIEMQMLKNGSSEAHKDVEAVQTNYKKEDSLLKADLLLRIENLQSELRVLSSGVEEYKDFAKRPSKEVDRVKEEIAMRTRMLEERSKNMEERNRSLEEKNRGLEDRLRAMDERVRLVDDRIKGVDAKLEQVSKQVDQEKAALAAARELALVRDREKEKEKETAADIKLPPPAIPSTGPGSLYNDAYQSFQKGDHEGARKKFEAFLKQYPNTELSDNAQFWIGETYYQKKDYEKAILEYEKVLNKYPEGDKVPAALFKQALAFSELGDKNNSRNLLKRVIERYPQSEQAEMAKKRMEAMK